MPNTATAVKPTKITARSSSSAKSQQLEATVPATKEYPTPVASFVKADQQEKAGKALKALLKPLLAKAALRKLYPFNVAHPTGAVTSVNLVDKDGVADKEHAYAQFQFRNSYSPVAIGVAERMLSEQLDVDDPNIHLVEVVTARFNDEIFVKPDGGFNVSLFNKMRRAVAEVAKEAGVEVPLLMEKMIIPKEDFHGRRWLDFPSAEEQAILTDILPNSTACAAKAPKKKS